MSTCSCGTSFSPSDKFCTGCGASLAGHIAPTATRQPTDFQWRWALATIPIVVGVTISLWFGIGFVSAATATPVDEETTLPLIVGASMFFSMFIGGLVVGLLSPGRTVFEPAVGIAAAVVALNLMTLNLSGVITDWLLPFGMGAAGAAIGEWLQGRLGWR